MTVSVKMYNELLEKYHALVDEMVRLKRTDLVGQSTKLEYTPAVSLADEEPLPEDVFSAIEATTDNGTRERTETYRAAQKMVDDGVPLPDVVAAIYNGQEVEL